MNKKNPRNILLGLALLLFGGGIFFFINIVIPLWKIMNSYIFIIVLSCIVSGLVLGICVDKKYPDEDDF